MQRRNKAATVKGDRGRSYKWVCTGNAHSWETKGTKQVPEWLDVSSRNTRKSVKQVKETKLVWGTLWEPPLEMAMSMDPPPQVIFFMTDGQTGPGAGSIVDRVATKANRENIMINTFALMETRTHQEMSDMAAKTGGEFTIIEANGEPRKVKIKGKNKLKQRNRLRNK